MVAAHLDVYGFISMTHTRDYVRLEMLTPDERIVVAETARRARAAARDEEARIGQALAAVVTAALTADHPAGTQRGSEVLEDWDSLPLAAAAAIGWATRTEPEPATAFLRVYDAAGDWLAGPGDVLEQFQHQLALGMTAVTLRCSHPELSSVLVRLLQLDLTDGVLEPGHAWAGSSAQLYATASLLLD